MDLLTHAATGLFLSRAGLRRWSPRATPILILSAIAPDVDIVAALGGWLNYLHYHRHLTHSLAAMPVMALLAVGVTRVLGRRPVHWVGAFLAALIGVASHLALDLTNSYGIRLFLPFSNAWPRLDLTNVIDLWIWAGLLLGGIAPPIVNRLVGSEITSSTARVKNYGRASAVFALAFLLLYDCGRGVLHARAVGALESRVYGESIVRVAALPQSGNPLRWRGLVETADAYLVADLDLAGDFDPTRLPVFRKPEADPVIEAARHTAAFQEFLRFSQFPLWRVSPIPDPENGRLVELIDMRFGTPLAPGPMVKAVVDGRLRPVETSFRWGLPRPR